ncbi:hypothetical protein BDZ89DRAFT_964051 [Hymenopellis radicata]|nr:hypothetical protein BDZ89DRAFT_964051 [Hymenopellis radicata]
MSLFTEASSSTLFSDPGPPKARVTKWDHCTAVLACISEHFESFGDFMEVFSHNCPRDDPNDPRSEKHILTLSAWLDGRTRFRPVHLVEAIYRNRYSIPHAGSVSLDERQYIFDAERDETLIRSSRVALSIWATKLVGAQCRREVHRLGKEDSANPDFRVQLQASTNARMKGKKKLVSQADVWDFSMRRTADELKRRGRTTWYITECMAGTRKNGIVVIRKNRPHPFVQAAAISSFVLARNKAANGYLGMIMGVWMFSCKAHIDLKRVYSRLAISVSDTTARNALNALGEHSLSTLRTLVAEHLERREPYCRKVLDNVQQYQLVHEAGLGKVNKLVTGTAATAIQLDDCAPGAFDLDEYQRRVMKNERATLTVADLFDSIDFEHLHRVSVLHVLRILCEFIPQLAPLRPQISARFRSEPIKKHRMRDGRKTVLFPLGTNGEYEMETTGMKAAQEDFDAQVGYTSEKVAEARVLIWDGGDGGSFGVGLGVQTLCLPKAVSKNVHESFENRRWTTGIWHKKATMQNSLAQNFFGPRTSKDPSSLSRAASATGLHRPPKLDKCDFYPTSRTMQLVCEAQVLDCWSIVLADHEDLLPYFENLSTTDSLPSLDDLEAQADTIVKRWATSTAFRTAGSKATYERAPSTFQAPQGPAWESISPPSTLETSEPVFAAETVPEAADFDGDRTLSNSILFVRDFLLWMELAYATADGDIGRVWEVLKIWIFMFAGSSNTNYVNYLLELYCLFRYEASKDLKDAIWNNWLVNITGELGKWIEDDLLQEHFNRWYEDMIAKHGGTFDDAFFRSTISPNVNFFLRLKEEIETAFELTRRSKSHTSPHLRAEFRILLTMFRIDKLHYFISGRSFGFIAKDTLNIGYASMYAKLTEFLSRSSEYVTLLTALRGEAILSYIPHREMRSDDSDDDDQEGADAGDECRERVAKDVPRSGSDLAFEVDAQTGAMSNDWYDEEEYEELMGGSISEPEDDDPEDETDT